MSNRKIIPIKFSNYEIINDTVSKVKIYVLYTGHNRNGSHFTKESIEKALPTIFGVPVVGEYSENIENFKGHGGKVEITTDGINYVETTKPYGFIDLDKNISDPRWEVVTDENGEEKEYLVINAFLWRRRYPELDVVFEKSSNQSMEILVDDYELMEDEYANITEFKFDALCILGRDELDESKNTEPCFEDSRVIAYSLDKSEFKAEFSKMVSEIKESFQEELTNFPNSGDNDKISLKNSKFPQADYDYVLNLKEEYPDIWGKGGNEFGNTAFLNWAKVRNGETSDSLEEWIVRRERFMERHEKNSRVEGVVAVFKWGGIVSRGQSYMKKLINEEKKKYSEDFEDDIEYSIPKDRIGTGKALDYSTSKEDADFETSWGDVNKIELRDDIYEASNYKTLIDKFYLIKEEGWEENQTAVKYPVGIKSGDKIVLSANGCQTALSFLERNKDDPQYESAKSKLKKYYEKLGLDTSNFKNERSYSMLSIEQIKDAIWEQLNPVDEDGRRQYNAWIVATFPEEKQVIINREDDGTALYKRHSYDVSEDGVVTLDEGIDIFAEFLTQEEKDALDSMREESMNAEKMKEEFEAEKTEFVKELEQIKKDYELIVDELNQYKAKERMEAEEEIFSAYNDSLNDNAEFNSLKERSSEFSLEDLEKEIALVFVKSTNIVSKKENKDPLVKEKFTKKKEKTESQYGDLFEKFGK